MIFIFFLIRFGFSIEINPQMGFAKSTHQQKLIILNGHFPVPYKLTFENRLINASELTVIGNDLVKCTGTQSQELIAVVNQRLKSSFREVFEPLQMDLVAKERNGRGVILTAATSLGLAAGQHLITKAIDYLFESRRTKTETSVSDLAAKLKVIKHDLDLSALEMCALGSQVLTERINRISTELISNTETQIKREIQALYFGDLDRKYSMAACLALNMNASKLDCLRVLRYKKLDFEVTKIDVNDDSANVYITIQTPIISETLVGFRYFNVGVPKVVNGKNYIAKGKLPDFVTPTNNYRFLNEPSHNVIAQQSLLSNPEIDSDCYVNATGTDNICDATTIIISSDYLIESVDGHTILINFVPCSFTSMNDLDLPTFLEKGVQIIKLERGFLTCGNTRLTFDHISLHHRKKVSYSNYTTNFNLIDSKIFKDLKIQNIFDDDHIFEQVVVAPMISFRVFLIILFSIILIVSIVGLVLFKNKLLSLYREIRRPSVVF